MATLDDLIAGVNTYRDDHLEQGGFLTACLENDLYKAVALADGDSLDYVRELMQHIFLELPIRAWGSRDNVSEWLLISGEADDPN